MSKTNTASTKPILERAPVVAVLGHVDHGKTSLLDAIRKTKIQATETGGITQHIGAYQILHHNQPITFIDTPGHAAFAKMRARGAQATDIVVLVVAATEGVKPQTKESIQHAKAAGVPIIVALNKIDMPTASVDMVNAQLAQAGLIVEADGGDIVTVETSATKGIGIDQLLDMIVLVSQMQSITGNQNDALEAVIIESKLEKNRGAVASIILRHGSLRVGDHIQAGDHIAKVRAIFNQLGASVKEVKPGEPAEILGFSELPPVGERIVRVGESPAPIIEKETTPTVIELSAKAKAKLAAAKKKFAIKEEEIVDETTEEEAPKPRIKAVLKADTQGTLEAIKTNVSDEVEIIGSGVGEVTESDVLLAQSTGAKVIAFRVPGNKSAQKLADLEKITIKTYQTIYELLEDLEMQVLKILEPTIDEEVLGEAEIIAQFLIKDQTVAGCKVTSGKLEANGQVHVQRNGKITHSSTIASLRQGHISATVAKKGEECGLTFKPALDFKVGDKLQYYRVVPQT